MALGGDTGNRQQAPWRPCPYGQPGDLLWVRETWNALYPVAGDDIPWYHHELSPEQRIQPATPIYRASEDGPNYPTSDDIEAGFKWQPSIFMPRWASRILLRVVSVRVERLQDITEADAQAEGMPKEFEVDAATFVQGQPLPESTHYLGFKHLWREINGAESWDANPWVWVVEFEVVK